MGERGGTGKSSPSGIYSLNVFTAKKLNDRVGTSGILKKLTTFAILLQFFVRFSTFDECERDS